MWLFYFGSQPSVSAEASGVNEVAEAHADDSGQATTQLAKDSQWPYIAVAVHSYRSDDPEELSFVKNERLLIATFENAWWMAKNASGDQGIVPGNYLHLQ